MVPLLKHEISLAYTCFAVHVIVNVSNFYCATDFPSAKPVVMPLCAPSRLTLLAATSNPREAFHQPLMNTLGAFVSSFIAPPVSTLNWTYFRPLVTRTMQIPTLPLKDGHAIPKVTTICPSGHVHN